MSMDLPSITRVRVKGMRVLVRADLNVPMANGQVTDRTRIERFAPTVRSLADRGARVIVASHMGRPGGRDPSMSLAPIARELEFELEQPVMFVPDCVGEIVEHTTGLLGDGSVALLENLRFHPGEEENDPGFAARLARVADLYVNDAFSCSHRAHASTHAIAWELPAFAGPSFVAEVAALGSVLGTDHGRSIAVVGGSKVSTKLSVLENLVPKVHQLVVGGGMANTFLAARGCRIGRSLHEPDLIETARAIERHAHDLGCSIVLPRDVVVASQIGRGLDHQVVPADSVPDGMMILDIGPQSIAELKTRLQTSRLLLWNGPLGVFEVEPFGTGTFTIARAAARLTRTGKLTSVAGGGDTVAALNAAGAAEGFTYVSTAGGAFLEWLEGKELPGMAALTAQTQREDA